MRRWFAVLMLWSMVSAQLSALACPAAHHTTSEEPAEQAVGSHSMHAPAPQPDAEASGLNSAPVSQHGEENQCVMMLTCTAVATVRPSTQVTAGLDQHILRIRVPLNSYINPSLSAPTPPPKLA